MLRRLRDWIADEPIAAAIAFTALITLARYAHLAVIATDLGPDEAQYWFWSQDLAWGYYSKPPMVAWLIAGSTSVVGEHTLGVRFFTPLLFAGTGLALFAAGRRLFGDKSGLLSLVFWHLMPAVLYGGVLIATDIPMLMFLSLTLWSLIGWIAASGGKRWAALTGLLWGLTFLSKYAALFLLPGLGLAALTSSYFRRGVNIGEVLIFLIAAGLVASPNIVWNLQHRLYTFKHTFDNANWQGFQLQFGEFGQFLIDQFAVLGPLLFGIFLVGLVRYRFRGDPKEALLLSLALPTLVVVALQALLSRAHANWTMAAYPPLLLLLPLWLMRMRAENVVLPLTIALHAAAWAGLVAITTDLSRADQLGLSSAVKRFRGWEETADAIRAELKAYDGLLLDDREMAAHLVWEMRDNLPPLQVYDANGRIDSTYELAFPYARAAEGTWLLASERAASEPARYEELAPQKVGTIFIDLHAETRGRPDRTIDLYRVDQSSTK